MIGFTHIKVGTIDELMELLRPMTEKEKAEARVQDAREEVQYCSAFERAASQVHLEATKQLAIANRLLYEADLALQAHESDEDPDREVADPEGPNAPVYGETAGSITRTDPCGCVWVRSDDEPDSVGPDGMGWTRRSRCDGTHDDPGSDPDAAEDQDLIDEEAKME